MENQTEKIKKKFGTLFSACLCVGVCHVGLHKDSFIMCVVLFIFFFLRVCACFTVTFFSVGSVL